MAISDLTGTKWLFNNFLDFSPLPTVDASFALNFNSNGTAYTSLSFEEDFGFAYMRYNSYIVYSYNWESGDPDCQTIEITGGSAATSANLISWLEANATQVPALPSYTFDLSSLSLASGTHSITAKAKATGYADSQVSNAVSYTVSGGGYNLTLNIISRNYDPQAWASSFCIKANGTPSDAADWDYAFVLPYAGSTGWVEDKDGNELVDVGYSDGGTCTLPNINSITFWRNAEGGHTPMFVGVNSNTTAAPIWSNTQTITLSADTTIDIYYDYDY